MTLAVIWKNATRPDTERWQVERAYLKVLTAICPDDAYIQQLMDRHAQQPSPHSEWERINRIAHKAAVADLMPNEQTAARFIVRYSKEMEP